MVIVRIYPSGPLEESWNKVLDNLRRITNDHSTPLYLSRREEENFMTLIYDVESLDFFGDIVAKSIPSLLRPEKTRTISLLRPVFFPAPKDRPANLERFQVAIRSRPEETENIFNSIISMNYPRDAFPTYAAYSFGEDDILTSMLSTSRDRIERFVRENFELRKGVLAVDVGHITQSKRVAPADMWKRYRENRYLFKPTAGFEELDFLEYTTAPGVPVGEMETSSFW